MTHDQEEALAISDRIAVMNDGRVEQIGAPARDLRAPATAFVADFIGSLNALDLTIDEVSTGRKASQHVSRERASRRPRRLRPRARARR